MVAPIALLGLWFLMRVGIFIADRFLQISPTLEIVAFSNWVLRMALLLAGLDALAFFGFLAALGLNGSGLVGHALVPCIATAVYALLALVLNFPGFPLPLHRLLVFPAQFLQLPLVAIALGMEGAFLPIVVPTVLFTLLWVWNVHDRATLAEFMAASRREQTGSPVEA